MLLNKQCPNKYTENTAHPATKRVDQLLFSITIKIWDTQLKCSSEKEKVVVNADFVPQLPTILLLSTMTDK